MTGHHLSLLLRCQLAAAMAFCLGTVAVAQAAGGGRAAAGVPPDPYTLGDKAALAKAGYVSLGPFEFGPAHTTKDVEQLLGDEPLHWIETAHFRIGCALSATSLRRADPKWAAGVKRELAGLRKRMPKVPKSPRELDPWLRAHLIAYRLEDCYARISADLGVDDGRFPKRPDDPNGAADDYWGIGPFFGMAEKYSVLIVKRGASLARYTRKYTGQETMDPFRMHYDGYGALGFSIAEEADGGLMSNDDALHSHLVYNTTVNLLNGYRSYGHDIPPWLLFGLAHWQSRRVSPKYPTYERKLAGEKEDSAFWKWDERALGLMEHDAFETIEELMARQHIGEFGMEQHIQAWFFCDFLMQAKPSETMKLLHLMKAPFHGKLKLPSHAETLERQQKAFLAAFGCEPGDLEEQWRKYARTGKRRK